MPENSIAIITPERYPNQKKDSIKSVGWKQGVAQKLAMKFYHALNGGEKKLCGHYVDGCNPASNTVKDFIGMDVRDVIQTDK